MRRKLVKILYWKLKPVLESGQKMVYSKVWKARISRGPGVAPSGSRKRRVRVMALDIPTATQGGSGEGGGERGAGATLAHRRARSGGWQSWEAATVAGRFFPSSHRSGASLASQVESLTSGPQESLKIVVTAPASWRPHISNSTIRMSP